MPTSIDPRARETKPMDDLKINIRVEDPCPLHGPDACVVTRFTSIEPATSPSKVMVFGQGWFDIHLPQGAARQYGEALVKQTLAMEEEARKRRS